MANFAQKSIAVCVGCGDADYPGQTRANAPINATGEFSATSMIATLGGLAFPATGSVKGRFSNLSEGEYPRAVAGTMGFRIDGLNAPVDGDTLQNVSYNGGVDIAGAEGEYLGFTLKKEFDLTSRISLAASAHADRFLGGSADIRFGRVDLPEGGWQHPLSLESELAVGRNATLRISAKTHLPAAGESRSSVFAGYSLRF